MQGCSPAIGIGPVAWLKFVWHLSQAAQCTRACIRCIMRVALKNVRWRTVGLAEGRDADSVRQQRSNSSAVPPQQRCSTIITCSQIRSLETEGARLALVDGTGGVYSMSAEYHLLMSLYHLGYVSASAKLWPSRLHTFAAVCIGTPSRPLVQKTRHQNTIRRVFFMIVS